MIMSHIQWLPLKWIQFKELGGCKYQFLGRKTYKFYSFVLCLALWLTFQKIHSLSAIILTFPMQKSA